jgi:hypothetical protein
MFKDRARKRRGYARRIQGGGMIGTLTREAFMAGGDLETDRRNHGHQ